jgi:hypothetical protein
MSTINLKYVNAMSALCAANGFTVTASTNGKHKEGSRHYRGLAIDVRTKDKSKKQVDAFIILMQNEGYNVFDERTARSKDWTAPHLHIWTYSDEEKAEIEKKKLTTKLK